MGTVITPGGRVGNDASHNRSPRDNWVDQEGGLPRYIRIVRNGLMKHGHSESQATRLAVAAMKRWAHGGNNVTPKVQAAAAAALAQWEKMKASAHAKGIYTDDFEFKNENTFAEDLHPRGAAGSANGGKFVKKGTSSSSSASSGPEKDANGKVKKYTIQKGDTLSELAEKFGTTVEALMKINPQIKDPDLIYTGNTLHVDSEGNDVDAKKKEAAKKTAAKKTAAKKTSSSSGSGSSSSGSGSGSGGSGSSSTGSGGSGASASRVGRDVDGSGGYDPTKKHEHHSVRRGETTAELAQKYHTTVRALERLNPWLASHKPGDPLPHGKRLIIPNYHGEKHPATKKVAPAKKSEVAGIETKTGTLIDDTETTEEKDESMEIEYKTVHGGSGVTVVDDENGIVETIVSVTGLKDNVKDVIHPGAYAKSLAKRTPKGVWSHKWETPVSKTLEIAELQPKDDRLPAALPDGTPWPENSGGLLVKTQFNLETQRGKEAYSDVKFFGDDQEWSIGYRVPKGGATIDQKAGVRNIYELELYEYSPVLFGAMSAARTQKIKSALEEVDWEHVSGAEFKQMCDDLGVEFKGDLDGAEWSVVKAEQKEDDLDEGTEVDEAKVDESFEDAADVFAALAEKSAEDFTAYEYEWLVKAHDTISAVLQRADEQFVPEDEAKSIVAIIEEQADALGDYAQEMKADAAAFDAAYDANDSEALFEKGNALLDFVEEGMDSGEDGIKDAMDLIAVKIVEMTPEDEAEDAEDNGADEEAEGETPKKRSIPPRPSKKDDEGEIEQKVVVNIDELKDMQRGGFFKNLSL